VHTISLFSKTLYNLLRSPMSFFDTTPQGRILNRFGHLNMHFVVFWLFLFLPFKDPLQRTTFSNVILWHNPARSHLESLRQRRRRHGRVDADDVARVAEQLDDHRVFSHHHCLHHSSLLDTCGSDSCLLLSHSKVRLLYYSLLDTCGSYPCLLLYHSKVTPSLLDTCGTVWQWFLPFTISFKGKNLSSWYLWHWFLPFTISFKGKTCK